MDVQPLAEKVKGIEAKKKSNQGDNFFDDALVVDVATETLKNIRRAAMGLLARREHSYRELIQKLTKRFSEIELIRQTLDRLEKDNLLSNQRFTEAYIRARSNKGFGPQRIEMELREKGVSEQVIAVGMEEAAIDWVELAAQIKYKKFGDHVSSDSKSMAKVYRFMNYRGFTQ